MDFQFQKINIGRAASQLKWWLYLLKETGNWSMMSFKNFAFILIMLGLYIYMIVQFLSG